jgi:hypothetical protein
MENLGIQREKKDSTIDKVEQSETVLKILDRQKITGNIFPSINLTLYCMVSSVNCSLQCYYYRRKPKLTSLFYVSLLSLMVKYKLM